MILVVVGTQLPFDRMTRAVDDWCGRTAQRDVFAQIGPTKWRPKHMQFAEFLDPAEYRRRFVESTLLVAHAGMGSIIDALTAAKPIVIMPRRAALGEHRNDHQLATVSRFSRYPGVYAASDENALPRILDEARVLTAGSAVGPHASPQLVERLRSFIHRT
ncbi:MAG: glycosyltransferase [Planctomycetota bacterium]|nr:glycosyltransferase [Planctomycetota bacterium]